MDPDRHAQRSARRHGGEPDDFYALHAFFDVTKELCSDNRHRLLHNLWGIRRVVIPLFGPHVALTGGGRARTKDVCEHDHVLLDFRGLYLPTLADFTGAIAEEPNELARFEALRRPYLGDDDVVRLLLSPYAVTGHPQALLVTHNTWFLAEVLPRLFPHVRHPTPRGVAPSELFARMRFELWMDNGAAPPPSAPRGIQSRESADPSDRPTRTTDPARLDLALVSTPDLAPTSSPAPIPTERYS